MNELEYSRKTFYWHYAWVIVVIVAGVQIVGTSIRMAFGVFIDPLEESFGWSKSDIAVAYALTSIVSAFVSPAAGYMADRFGAKITMYFGVIIFLVGMILTSYISQLWHFWLSYGVVLGIAQAIFLVPLIPAAMLWFRRHLGLAMGLIMCSWGVGPALATPVIAYLINLVGWKSAFIYIGVVSTILMLMMTFIFKNRPSDRGTFEYGTLEGDEPLSTHAPAGVLLSEFQSHMRKTAAFWNMSSIHFLGCVGHAVILIWLIPMATDRGLGLVYAASIFSMMSIISVSTRLATPILCEKFGVRIVMTIFYVLQGVPVLLLFFTGIPNIFVIFAITFGIGYGGETGGFPILNRKYFGHAPMGSVHGFQMFGAGLGMAFGGWVGGPIYDIFGSYNWALWISVIASLGGAVSIVLLENTSKLLIPDWIKSEKELESLNSEAPTG